MSPQLIALLLTSFIVTSAVLTAVGWYFIRRRKIEQHQKLMVAASLFATVFFILYVSKTFIVGSTQFGGPADVKIAYLIFLVFHIILATAAGAMGIITLVYAYKKQFQKHKRIGPWASVIWFCSAATGVMVYLLLYVIYPSGETKSVTDLLSQ
ncbi:DUF420 domain-containing protein [Brevibacillus humidisoli]|uniref:DUF420 domain-containing protein n=1 Tax=Brevibacillus humidisoli TaxID=2895522 RepID=UPI001E29D58B|nr:DUF420 domain-containing protein [Brevibacillus humidisoli]UFJ42339.1 DUF420 domain-containing protein [Brevibacillus humidisoli]